MSEEERYRLINFLQQMVQTRTDQVDHVARDMILEAISNQPMHAYLLVQRAMQMEKQISLSNSSNNPGSDLSDSNSSLFFNPQSTIWGQNKTVKNNMTDTSASSAGVKKLNRFDLEEHAINFLGNNAGKVWIAIAILAYFVVTNR